MRAIISLNPSAHGSYDALLVNTLVVLVVSDCGRALSLDARYRGRGGPAKRFARLLLIAQLTICYFGSGIGKASSTWIPGGSASALWFILQQPTWAKFPSLPLWAYPFTQIATTSTWIWEVSAPLMGLSAVLETFEPQRAWLKRLKGAFARVRFLELYLLFGLFMHLGIDLFMEVGPFSWASLAFYPALLGPRRIDKMLAWLKAKVDQRRTSE